MHMSYGKVYNKNMYSTLLHARLGYMYTYNLTTENGF